MDVVHAAASNPKRYFEFANSLASAVVLPEQRAEELENLLQAFVFVIPKVRSAQAAFPRTRWLHALTGDIHAATTLLESVPRSLKNASRAAHSFTDGTGALKWMWLQARAPAPKAWCCRPDLSALEEARVRAEIGTREFLARSGLLRTAAIRQQLFFPDRRLIQFDCGKLQVGTPLGRPGPLATYSSLASSQPEPGSVLPGLLAVENAISALAGRSPQCPLQLQGKSLAVLQRQ